MHKASLLADQLAFEYTQNEQKQFNIVWKAPIKGVGETFITSFEKGVIQLQAESPLAAAFGISQLKVAIASDHLGDFIGVSQPRFNLRPLWLGCENYMTSDGLEVALPRCIGMSFDNQQKKRNAELLCCRTIDLGYNSILLGKKDSASPTLNSTVLSDMVDFIHLAHSYGLKVIVKSTPFLSEISKKSDCCPLSPSYQEQIIHHINLLLTSVVPDYFFWESSLLDPGFSTHYSARDVTFSELVIKEMHLLENALNDKSQLIFFIPSSDIETAHAHAAWMPHLCDETRKKTIIAFSAVAGDYCADHLPPHPFWEKLRRSPSTSITQLFPLVNVGSISHGEGLWPTPTTDLLDKYYSRLHRHRFAGVLVLTNALPQPGGILDCNLWTASQVLWRNLPSWQITETWFAAFRPNWIFGESSDLLLGMRQIAVKLGYLRSIACEGRSNIASEDCRIMTDQILTSLRDLKGSVEKLERRQFKKGKGPMLSDYLQSFSWDAQSVVLHFLQCYNLSFPFILEEGEMKDSFWTHLSSGSSQGIRSSSKISFLEVPRRGLPGSAMEAIYLENRYL